MLKGRVYLFDDLPVSLNSATVNIFLIYCMTSKAKTANYSKFQRYFLKNFGNFVHQHFLIPVLLVF